MLAVTEGISSEHLQEVYSDSYIARSSHDHRPFCPISHPNAIYLSAWVGNSFAGAFLAIRQSAVELELHSLLKRCAIHESRELARHFLAWAFSFPSVLRVTAYIIESLESARNFCLKLGFVQEGIRRDACVKNGQVRGIYILGMTREEWDKS